MTNTATERVGRYQLVEPIGIGPTGSVSRAKVFGAADSEPQFAIKRFHPDLTSSASVIQALGAAARAYGGIEHPRIARMSEFGTAQGETFTAVEYVSGLDAMRLVVELNRTNSSLAPGSALALVSQAARAIGYAHGRGLAHLGLSPSNVVITSEGDVKITDFGILAATLPPHPLEILRLAKRIGYLAPEQLANEATSAATDVFALGVLAYELVTGQAAFRGATPQEIAKAVGRGPPPEPSLPAPIVRVLQRCLARSPFERFPDARALADALDAAMRVAPVPGTRQDLGATVKQLVDRLAAGSREPAPEITTIEFVRPGTPVAIAQPLVGAEPPPKPGQTLPIAVSVDEPADRSSESPMPPRKMMLGSPSGSPPPVPTARAIPARLNEPPQVPGARRSDTGKPGAARTDLAIETDPGDAFVIGTSELPIMLVKPQTPPLPVEIEIVVEHAQSPGRPTSSPNGRPEAPAALVAGGLAASGQTVERKTLPGFQPSHRLPAQRAELASADQAADSGSPHEDSDLEAIDVRQHSKAQVIAAAILGTMALGASVYVAYDLLSAEEPSGGSTVAVGEVPELDAKSDGSPEADSAIAATVDAGPAPADAAATPDAATAEPVGPTASLSITSTPAGARAYLDGSDSGVTPLTLPGTPDKHTIALFSPGHELYVAQVQGEGAYAIPLKEVTPSGGPAGIKVTKCAKDRYYVFVDGKATGMVCPTERIEVDLGNHTVEVYDMVSETRRQFQVVVKDTRLSVRVKVE